MGRIAEALKRAEQEREIALGRKSDTVIDLPAVALNVGPQVEMTEPWPAANEIAETQAEDQPVNLVDGLSESLVPFFERSSVITEQYRSLRTRLLSQNPHYEHRVLAITSAIPKEGKSVSTLNIGCVLAEIRHLKVLVVDGDFRRGSLASMLNQSKGPGFAEVLSGEASYSDVIQKTPIPNLSFIAAGDTKSRSPAELLASAAAKPIIQRMRNEFHYTIVDTPPATTVTDVGIIGQMCTGVIVIVRLNRTDESAAKRTVRLLQGNNVPILGCLVVGHEATAGRYGSGYTYYRYYEDYHSKESSRS